MMIRGTFLLILAGVLSGSLAADEPPWPAAPDAPKFDLPDLPAYVRRQEQRRELKAEAEDYRSTIIEPYNTDDLDGFRQALESTREALEKDQLSGRITAGEYEQGMATYHRLLRDGYGKGVSAYRALIYKLGQRLRAINTLPIRSPQLS